MILHRYKHFKEQNSYEQLPGTHLNISDSDLNIFKSLSFETDVTARIPKYFINSAWILLILFLWYSITLSLFNTLYNEKCFNCISTLPLLQRRKFQLYFFR